MPLAPGTQLGPYEIIGPLGVGGMGEVYRARDSKLGREVALKVLPAAFAADTERMARFRREAQVLASLNHPNIAAVYGLEDGDAGDEQPPTVHPDPNSSSRAMIFSGTPPALVMELVEGPTLAERLRMRRLDLEDSLPIARQIAEGLEAAHDRGIIHRDLKPANVKIRPDGVVKILDFGLAKAVQGDTASSDLQNSPTISHMTTMAGTILGTAAYMSPEQAKGKTLDRRTDVWSFGCVLFEMLSGKQAFSGETSTDILADVIRGEPRWQELPANTPPRLTELLRRCLQKDTKQRLQAIGEARIAIEQTSAEMSVIANSSIESMTAAVGASSVQTPNTAGAAANISAQPPAIAFTTPAARRASAFPWILATFFAGLAAWLGYAYLTHTKNPAPAIVTQILPPDGQIFALTGNDAGPPILSPDGSYVAFVTSGAEGVRRLWFRPLNDAKAQLVAGSEEATEPFWAPDSRTLGFFGEGGALFRVSLSGGGLQKLLERVAGRGAAWGPDGKILFNPNPQVGLAVIADTGGTPQMVTRADPRLHLAGRRWPQFLPDGKHFLCFARSDIASQSGVFVGTFDEAPLKLVFHADTNAVYAPPGYLLFVQQGILMAQKFDLNTFSVSGQPKPIAPHAEINPIIYRAILTASDTGLLIYGTGSEASGTFELRWVDRSGKLLATVGDPAEYTNPLISMDGRKLAVSIDSGEGGNNLWVLDSQGGTRSRVTFGAGNNGGVAWSPDGKTLIYSSNRDGNYQLYEQPADGSGEARRVTDGTDPEIGASWSRDGRFVAYEEIQIASHGKTAIRVIPRTGQQKPYTLVNTEYDVSHPSISPDSKWLAFSSMETGHPEIYVVPLGGGAGKWQISANGGEEPIWSPLGNEIFFVSPENKLMAAQVTETGNSMVAGKIEALFPVSPTSSSLAIYDVAPDAKKFLITSISANRKPEPLTVVSNWTALLPK
jgi:eukaryotic-like serine/threonine-protein kinase